MNIFYVLISILLLVVTLIYFFIKRKDQHVRKLIRLVSLLFIASAVFTMAWIIVFSYELLGISTLLVSLTLIIKGITNNRSQFPSMLAEIGVTPYSSGVFTSTIVTLFVVISMRAAY